ncbi:MAG: DNA repair protein RadC [Veillonellaceae bacterium]|nr:DNA repair protein RadC [Veillonellaceae bacterium]
MNSKPDDYSDLPLFAKVPEEHYFVRSHLVRESRLPLVIIQSSDEAARYIRGLIGDFDREAFVVLALNTRHGINATSIVHLGSVNESIVDPADVLRVALYSNAKCLIVAHNHPSGTVSPSTEDRTITKKIKEAAVIFSLTLLDHIIIGGEDYYSFADQGLL